MENKYGIKGDYLAMPDDTDFVIPRGDIIIGIDFGADKDHTVVCEFHVKNGEFKVVK